MDSAIRHTWFDRVLPWLLGAGVAALAWFTGNSLELPPELWDEIAVAAKLRPPVYEFPLFWQTTSGLLVAAVVPTTAAVCYFHPCSAFLGGKLVW